jgi:pimeloyl-ACP methyl ester carboxylesterase
VLAGPGVDGAAILKEQNTAIFRAAGTQGEVLDAIVRTHAALVDASVAGASEGDLRALAAAAVDAQVRAGGAAAAMAEGEGRSQVIDGVVQQMRAPWMLRFMKLDPAPALRALRCPVLALFGERDLQVLPERGRGDTRRAVADYAEKAPFFLPCGSFVAPWDKQPERSVLDFGNDRGRLAEGAFRIDAHARWMNSDEVQADFAERFSVPVSETYALKAVSTDVQHDVLQVRVPKAAHARPRWIPVQVD